MASKTLKDSLRGISIVDINITQATLNAVMGNLQRLDQHEQEGEIDDLMKHLKLHKQMTRRRSNLRELRKHNL